MNFVSLNHVYFLKGTINMDLAVRAHHGNMLDSLILVVGTCYRQAYPYRLNRCDALVVYIERAQKIYGAHHGDHWKGRDGGEQLLCNNIGEDGGDSCVVHTENDSELSRTSSQRAWSRSREREIFALEWFNGRLDKQFCARGKKCIDAPSYARPTVG